MQQSRVPLPGWGWNMPTIDDDSGNFSQNGSEKYSYNESCTVITVQITHSSARPMNNIDNIVKTIMSHPSLQTTEKSGISVRFRASEVELEINSTNSVPAAAHGDSIDGEAS